MKNINLFYRNYYKIITKFYGWKFRELGKKVCIFSPMQINNPKGITIHDNILIAHNAWLIGTEEKNQKGLVIQSGTIIGHFCHIVAKNSVIIQENVLIADKVFISDSTHSYERIELPIINQPVKHMRDVIIGEGSWIGENVCILGASIGKHSIIGSNAVVTHDIPDYCVAVGNPAKVVKQYDFNISKWINIKNGDMRDD